MRRLLALAICAALFIGAPLHAAGTVTRTYAFSTSGNTTAYTFTWLSDASGAVSGDATTIALTGGEIVRIELVPNGAGTQPTDGYDVTLLDVYGVDILAGAGTNLSNAAAALIVHPDIRILTGEAFQLVIANAGNAKGGTLKMWVAH
jgi:hypothetical protein